MRIRPTVVAGLTLCCSAVAVVADPIHLFLSAAHLTGATTRAATRPGHGGDGYATNFLRATDTATFRVPVTAAGPYDVRLRYCSPGGHKLVQLRASGVTADVMVPQTGQAWETVDAGRVELVAGDNDLSVGGGWGHYDLDKVDLTPARIDPPARPAVTLIDSDATPEARLLMQRLAAGYGAVTVSGGYGGTEGNYVFAQTDGHRRPAIYGADLMDFSPSRVAHGAKSAGIVEDVLRHAAQGQAITLSWHWNAPAHLLDTVRRDPGGRTEDLRWYKGFNTPASTFDLAAALADPRSAEHQLILGDVDAIAIPLQRLAAAGVPILWRPLHEAEGGWFWWGAKGPAPFLALWHLMHDRLTRVHGLHNLIWVYSGTIVGDPKWYPGDDSVDVVGTDAYPSDNRDVLGQRWAGWESVAPTKLRALTEFGGVPDVGRMHRLGCPWAYFVSWTEPDGPATKTGAAEVRRRYADDRTTDLSRWEKTQ